MIDMAVEVMFLYSVAVSIPLLVLWSVYRLLLANEKHLLLNRLIVNFIYVVSLALFPLLSFTLGSDLSSGTQGHIVLQKGIDGMAVIVKSLSVCWSIGAVIVLMLTLFECLRVFNIKRKCSIETFGKHKIYVSEESGVAPFSFGSMIVMSRKDFEKSPELIVMHELGHQKKRHTVDMFFSQLVAILCWYNPAAWFMRSELKTLHEYQADQYVLNKGFAARDYQLFLVGRSIAKSRLSIVNSLKYTQVRRRISMMNKPAYNNGFRNVRYIVIAVGVAVSVLILSQESVRDALNSIRYIAGTEIDSGDEMQEPLMDIYVDGVEIEWSEVNSISSSDIKAITVNKKDNRIEIESLGSTTK